MPFCPNCKAEYQEGYTVCSDCKVNLVDEIKEAEILVPFFQADDKKVAEKLVKFFHYSDLPSSMEYDEENQVYIVAIPPKRQMQAKKLYQAFYFVERERLANGESDLLAEKTSNDSSVEDSSVDDSTADDSAVDDSSVDDSTVEGEYAELEKGDAFLNSTDAEEDYDYSLEKEELSSGDDDYTGETPSDEITAFDNEDDNDGRTYVMKADQYKDLAGTVWVFLFFGIAGIIVVLLNVIGYLNFFNGWIPNTVMAALFLFFIYVALSTNSKAKKIQTEIDEENALTEKINEWLTRNITEAFLASNRNENISDELNYIKMTDTVKELLIKEFGSQNLAYLDRLIEEYYNNNFDN